MRLTEFLENEDALPLSEALANVLQSDKELRKKWFDIFHANFDTQ